MELIYKNFIENFHITLNRENSSFFNITEFEPIKNIGSKEQGFLEIIYFFEKEKIIKPNNLDAFNENKKNQQKQNLTYIAYQFTGKGKLMSSIDLIKLIDKNLLNLK